MNSAFDEKGLQFAWDSTSLKLADECLRKYYYVMIEGWRSKTRSVHLEFGAHFATALEHYYKHRAEGLDSNSALERVVEEALINTWKDGAPIEFLDNAKTRENLIRTIIWYVDQFEDETIKVVSLSDGRPAVEHSFSLPVDNGYIFAGHIDRLVEYSGEVYVMDQKTTKSTVTSLYFAQYATDLQMSMYTFAGQMIYNAPVKGVILDVAQIAVGFSRFERGFTFRSNGQLHEWYDDMMTLIESTRHATEINNFPMRRASCNNYGGCPFRSVCGRDASVRQNFLLADFNREETWNPLEKR